MSGDLIAGNNDNLLQVLGLKNSLTGLVISDAVITANVLDSTNTLVSGVTWPLTLNYISGTSGIYRVVLPASLNLISGKFYTINITAVSLLNGTCSWSQTIKATTR
jgi:hypothetical protein